jgi:hypothetical protein
MALASFPIVRQLVYPERISSSFPRWFTNKWIRDNCYRQSIMTSIEPNRPFFILAHCQDSYWSGDMDLRVYARALNLNLYLLNTRTPFAYFQYRLLPTETSPLHACVIYKLVNGAGHYELVRFETKHRSARTTDPCNFFLIYEELMPLAKVLFRLHWSTDPLADFYHSCTLVPPDSSTSSSSSSG